MDELFDPVRRALWDADVAREREIRQRRGLSRQRKRIAAAKARVAARRVYAIPEPGLPRLDFPNTNAACRELNLHAASIRLSLTMGYRGGGRLWWWTSRPESERPVTRTHRQDFRVFAEGIIYRSHVEFASAVGLASRSAERAVRRGYYYRTVPVATGMDVGAVIALVGMKRNSANLVIRRGYFVVKREVRYAVDCGLPEDGVVAVGAVSAWAAAVESQG